MATASTANIDKVKGLKAFAAGLRGATARWAETYADRKHYDKQNFGFSHRGELGAFTVPAITLEAYVGTYGSSSVGTALSINGELAKAYFVKALNVHKQAIFDAMADFAEADAKTLAAAAQAEVAALQKLLNEVLADTAPELEPVS